MNGGIPFCINLGSNICAVNLHAVNVEITEKAFRNQAVKIKTDTAMYFLIISNGKKARELRELYMDFTSYDELSGEIIECLTKHCYSLATQEYSLINSLDLSACLNFMLVRSGITRMISQKEILLLKPELLQNLAMKEMRQCVLLHFLSKAEKLCKVET